MVGTYIIAEYTWAGKKHRIEWESSMKSYVVRSYNENRDEWNMDTGMIPVNEVAVLLGAGRDGPD